MISSSATITATTSRFFLEIALLCFTAVSLTADTTWAFSTSAGFPRPLCHSMDTAHNSPRLTSPSSSSSCRFMTSHSSALSLSDTPENNDSRKIKQASLRTQLRNLTGFSLTALRKTMRAATGISLTAVYASTLTVTGAWIRQTMRILLAPFPAWFRYFLQPFLVMYYAPLFILRNLTGPTRKRAKTTHEHFLQGWKEAVETADKTSSYWPMHVNCEGNLEKDIAELDVTDTIAESVDIALEEEEKSHNKISGE